jgi:hypothetical protein
VLSYGAGLAGFTYGFDAGRVPTVLQDVHVLGALLIVACALVAVANLVRGVVRGRREEFGPQMGAERRWLDDALVIAMVGSVATFVVLAVSGVPGALAISSQRSCSPACSAAGSLPRHGSGCDRVA